MTLTVEIQEQRWRQQESIAHYSEERTVRNEIFAGRKESSIEEYVVHTKCTHPYRKKSIEVYTWPAWALFPVN